MSTASKVSRREGKDRLKALRLNATTTKKTHTISAAMDWVIMRNDGANDIKVNFKTDDIATNYWTLLPGESLPAAVAVFQGVDINYQSVGGPSKLEVILWA